MLAVETTNPPNFSGLIFKKFISDIVYCGLAGLEEGCGAPVPGSYSDS